MIPQCLKGKVFMGKFHWILCFILIPLTLLAQEPQDAPLTIGQVTQEAVEKNLNLMAERYSLSIADARRVTARLRPNPVFSFGLTIRIFWAVGSATVPATMQGLQRSIFGSISIGKRREKALQNGSRRECQIGCRAAIARRNPVTHSGRTKRCH